ncbi:adaptin c-terminal domain-containing protein [Cardiosporidium cionae]|uniref:Adaptin c-terminal domain-containing protein n=1 Tax=Cardiosporidium cionae TaxID=476202 RepID=A0ABQ7JDL6_9APIC|nr:adaptin c-terminal domain-containing protein [Cardiosporidium cionae]|eukprot:KAF8822107.1 adaptin c-terminal domain-containing protein [Cardiosporidium cionae]
MLDSEAIPQFIHDATLSSSTLEEKLDVISNAVVSGEGEDTAKVTLQIIWELFSFRPIRVGQKILLLKNSAVVEVLLEGFVCCDVNLLSSISLQLLDHLVCLDDTCAQLVVNSKILKNLVELAKRKKIILKKRNFQYFAQDETDENITVCLNTVFEIIQGWARSQCRTSSKLGKKFLLAYELLAKTDLYIKRGDISLKKSIEESPSTIGILSTSEGVISGSSQNSGRMLVENTSIHSSRNNLNAISEDILSPRVSHSPLCGDIGEDILPPTEDSVLPEEAIASFEQALIEAHGAADFLKEILMDVNEGNKKELLEECAQNCRTYLNTLQSLEASMAGDETMQNAQQITRVNEYVKSVLNEFLMWETKEARKNRNFFSENLNPDSSNQTSEIVDFSFPNKQRPLEGDETERLPEEKVQQEKEEAIKLKKEALEREKIAKEALEREKITKEALEREKIAKEALEREKIAKEALEREKAAKEALEREKIAKEALEREKITKEALEREKITKEALEREKAAKEALEREKIAKEALEREKAAKEALEREKAAKEALKREKIAKDALEREKIAKEALKREKAAKEALEREKAAKEALERKKAAKEEQERREKEILEKEQQKRMEQSETLRLEALRQREVLIEEEMKKNTQKLHGEDVRKKEESSRENRHREEASSPLDVNYQTLQRIHSITSIPGEIPQNPPSFNTSIPLLQKDNLLKVSEQEISTLSSTVTLLKEKCSNYEKVLADTKSSLQNTSKLFKEETIKRIYVEETLKKSEIQITTLESKISSLEYQIFRLQKDNSTLKKPPTPNKEPPKSIDSFQPPFPSFKPTISRPPTRSAFVKDFTVAQIPHPGFQPLNVLNGSPRKISSSVSPRRSTPRIHTSTKGDKTLLSSSLQAGNISSADAPLLSTTSSSSHFPITFQSSSKDFPLKIESMEESPRSDVSNRSMASIKKEDRSSTPLGATSLPPSSNLSSTTRFSTHSIPLPPPPPPPPPLPSTHSIPLPPPPPPPSPSTHSIPPPPPSSSTHSIPLPPPPPPPSPSTHSIPPPPSLSTHHLSTPATPSHSILPSPLSSAPVVSPSRLPHPVSQDVALPLPHTSSASTAMKGVKDFSPQISSSEGRMAILPPSLEQSFVNQNREVEIPFTRSMEIYPQVHETSKCSSSLPGRNSVAPNNFSFDKVKKRIDFGDSVWSMEEFETSKFACIGAAEADTFEKFRSLILMDDAILYEDETIQLGVQAEYESTWGEFHLFIGNKNAIILQNVETSFLCSEEDALQFDISPLPGLLRGKEQVFQQLTIGCVEPFEEIPILRLQYLLPDATPYKLDLYLPIVVSKFLSPLVVNRKQFLSFWNSQGFIHQSVEDRIFLNPLFDCIIGDIAEAADLGGRLAICPSVDPKAENIILFGSFPFLNREKSSNSIIPSHVAIRIETGSGRFRGKARLTIRSENRKLSVGLRKILQLVLGDVKQS